MNAVGATSAVDDFAQSQNGLSGAVCCFHCGLPVPESGNWNAKIKGLMRPMCCPGCQAVAQSIVDSGFGDYYQTRIGYSATADQQTLIPPELALYDSEENSEQFGGQKEFGEATFSIEGIRCAACVWLIERRMARLPGMRSADMNVATGRLSACWNRAVCKPSDILRTLREIGYVAYPFDAARYGEQLELARKKLFRRMFIAGLSMMQVMMYALPIYMASDGTMDADMTNLMRWAGLLLTLPAIGYAAQPFFIGAWINLKSHMLGMDVPVALGISAAFIGSVLATFKGQGDVYFDSITMFIFLLLCSRYLELGARRKAASALDNLQHALPASALRMAGYPAFRETELVAAGKLVSGDVILVKPGEANAADGVILEGDTAFDLSMLTGESRAQRMTIGANVPGGAVNVTQPVVLRVTQSTGESTLSVLMSLIERAGQGKPKIALWADRAAAWFVAVLLLFSVSVFIVWHFLDPSRAWPIAIAVLVVSCPCALSLATPTVLAAATNRLLRQGILVVQPHVLETLNQATHIIFDKTGTLTVGKPVLSHIEALAAIPSKQCLRVAASLAASSKHPLSEALVTAAAEDDSISGMDLFCGDIRHIAGQGLDGLMDGKRYRIGSLAFVQELAGSDFAPPNVPGFVSIYLGTENVLLARFDLADSLRADASWIVRYFQDKGKTVILLSGDHQSVTQHVADELGITTALGQNLPDQKLNYVQNLQRDGGIVAMVGDGINDAAVLSAADVSFAMGSGTALAQIHADCVLLSGQLTSLAVLNDTASKTLTVIRQNLFWATLYNLIAIPAAALGLLNPWMSGVGMSLSSVVVVLNALRLQRLPRHINYPTPTTSPKGR
ncbi:heavy metal translocating P-type ATPase [Solimicrobium silvestre]|uniref:Heavy metal translocating P-type ATPase n=1 Tax=Solimicrobium silvestre TaxID=2099400 RepID=A0A2S9H0J8_9BURK|nr:heavy metal translocating P-type ATPase [Solimicrobium silvestre]PRC93483.1 Heavy metal translocating P-type ATPase [Solimicrobium silvestre]